MKFTRPDRASALCIKNNHILLIYREKDGKEYWVLPGGGVEEGETPEMATEREVFEETGVKVRAENLLYEIKYKTGGNKFIVYKCDYLSGEPENQPGSTEEKKMKEDPTNIYIPQWFPIERLHEINLVNTVLTKQLIKDIKEGFSENVIKIPDLE